MLYCGYETFYGYTQLLGINKSQNYLFALTGSFDNPGPYGGFLAICICILGAYAYKNKFRLIKRSWKNIPYLLILIVAIASTIILPSTQSRTAILALVCSAVCFVIKNGQSMMINVKKIVRRYGIWIVVVASGLLATAYMFKKPSADGRFFIDKISILTICNNGLKGAGPGHFGGAYGETQAKYFYNKINEDGVDDLDWTVLNEKERLVAECPGSAFNEYLSIGVEYGPIVMLLLIFVIISAITVSFRRDGIWCYGLIAFSIFAFFSYPFHVFQLQFFFCILLVTCISGQEATCRKTGIVFLIVSLFLFSGFLKEIIPEYKQYKTSLDIWNKQKQWYDLGYYDYVVEDCETLLNDLKNDEFFLFAYGLSLNKTGNYEKSDTILRIGTKLSSNPMFWNIMGNNSLSLGRVEEAEQKYKHAFYMIPNRLYPLSLITNLYHEIGDTARFQNAVRKVESFIPKVESVTTDSLRNNIRKLH